MPLLASIAELKIVAQRPDLEDDDPFALEILEQASAKVTDYARHPEWESEDPEVYVAPPRAVRRIALWMAKRTFENPEAEVQYGLGPISGRTLDWQAYGLYLTPPEEAELDAIVAQLPSDGAGGLWLASVAGTPALAEDVYIDDVYGLQPIPYGDRSQEWAFTPKVD